MNNNKMTGGYSLLEVLVAIVILAVFSIGGYVGINKSIELNAQTQARIEAQMCVSSIAERLMAEGIESGDTSDISNEYSNAVITVSPALGTVDTTPFYKVTISSEYASGKPPVSINMNIKRVS